jgi:hypothetical protein
MQEYLYKVSAPRGDRQFYPSPFWHTPDWESSTTRCRDGYIEDDVLYAGDFDEVNIHLFPRVRTVRVRSVDVDVSSLQGLGVRCTPGKTAYIFIHKSRCKEVESFSRTIFKFHADGFVRVRKGEYVSRKPQLAISGETIPMIETLQRWNIEACFVDSLEDLIDRLRQSGVYFDEQT